MEFTDAMLVAKVLQGDQGAFTLLVDRHYPRCLRYAVRMLGDREEAEEAVQDTFLRAYGALGRYRDEERFAGWVFQILVNRVRTYAGRRRTLPIDPSDPRLAELPARDADPGLDLREDIARALARLDADQREAFLLKHVEDLTYEEMTGVTGASVPALKMRVKRACDRLRELLDGEGGA